MKGHREPRTLRWMCWLFLLIPLVLVVPGCGGCQGDDPATAAKKKKEKEEAEKKKKSEKPKDPFESQALVIEPGEGKTTSSIVKPGHWVTASQAFKSNDGDVVGDFYSAAVDIAGRPFEADHTPFRMVMTRSAPLPKGQTKHFEFLYYIPRRFQGQNATTRLQNKLYARGGGRELFHPGDNPVTRMEPYQYHMLVLASDPDRYGYLKRLESITPPADTLNNRSPEVYYRVSLPKLDKRVPLPRHPLAWTSIAYIFWDGIDPNLLSPEQQDGLLDWLHWGGQLIVSGPESMDTLRGSFLADHLPLEKIESLNLEQPYFEEMNAVWSLEDKKKVKRTLDVVAGKPPVGIKVNKLEGAEWVPSTGQLVAERRIGRGRIAVTTFSLTSRTLVNWASLDNFFNGALLRRPHRVYTMNNYASPEVKWVDDWARPNDPRLISTLRYFSRDIGYVTGQAQRVTAAPTIVDLGGIVEHRPPPSVIHPDITDWHFDGYTFDSENQSGVAGWNDFCAAADSARESLREAAGISIPKAGFVLQVLMMYLVVLVPANWAIFKVLGRVEWAWVAAPIIAIGGAIAVVKLAQLDIGFARSQSEIAILEMHHGHPRGHATRYTALYSSLSTAYDLRFEDPTALAQPFPTKPRDVTPGVFNREAPTTCYLQRDDGVSLTGFMVRSNTTDFVHSEQMVGLGGALKLLGDEQKGYSIENFTDFTIKDAAILRRVATGEAFVAYVGELRPKDNRTLAWVAVGEGLKPEEWSKSAVMSKQAAAGATEVSLHRLVDLATSRLRLDAGDIRLVGWMDDALPGLTITPAASQTTTRTLVLAHLQEAPLPPLKPDVNMKLTVIDPEEEETMPGEDIDNIMPPPIDPANPFGN